MLQRVFVRFYICLELPAENGEFHKHWNIVMIISGELFHIENVNKLLGFQNSCLHLY